MYYIYHIPGEKIGVSKEVERRVSKQGYTNYEILETHTCIFTVSDREIELQKEYGLPVDKIPYWQSIENRLLATEASKLTPKTNEQKEWMSSLGKRSTQNIEHQKKAARASVKSVNFALKKTIACEYCGKETRLVNHKRWHGDNCKQKKGHSEE